VLEEGGSEVAEVTPRAVRMRELRGDSEQRMIKSEHADKYIKVEIQEV